MSEDEKMKTWHELLQQLRQKTTAAYWRGQYNVAMNRIGELRDDIGRLQSYINELSRGRGKVYVVLREYSYPTFHSVHASKEGAHEEIAKYAEAFGGQIDYYGPAGLVYVTAPPGLHFIVIEYEVGS